MKSSKNILNKITSKYILNIIFNYMHRKTQLKLVQFNKNLQLKLNFSNHSYILYDLFYIIYDKLDEGKKINLKYNKNSDSIFNSVKNYTDKKEGIKEMLIFFFNDLYTQYYKDYIPINYYAEFFTKGNFNFLLSLNAPIRINIKFNLVNWYYTYKNKDIPLDIFNYNKIIYGMDFKYLYLKDVKYNLLESFLNKINKKFEYLDNIKITCRLLELLIDKNKTKFFENNFKKIEIYDYEKESFFSFINSFYKIGYLLKANDLKIHYRNYNDYSGFNNTLDLSGMKYIKKLEIKNESSFKLFNITINKETIESLDSLTLKAVNFRFAEYEYIKYKNLISLDISRVDLDQMFDFKNPNSFKIFPRLQQLSIEISSLIDCDIVKNILKNNIDLIELNLYNKGNYTYLNKNKNAEEELGFTILTLKNLIYLRINNFDNNCQLIDIIINNYKSNNLAEFESNCINLLSATQFIKNNKNLNKIHLNNYL